MTNDGALDWAYSQTAILVLHQRFYQQEIEWMSLQNNAFQ